MGKRIQTAGICIDIGEKAVKIIETSRDGKILKAGFAELSDNSGDFGTEYGNALTSAIKGAAKAANVSGGDCVIVVGGLHIIVHTFIWPEMPPDSLQINAESEIAPFLPSDTNSFSVAYKVLRYKDVQLAEIGQPIRQVEVLVAAMAKEFSETILSAVSKAGFKPKRIDVWENARSKLISNPYLWADAKANSEDAFFTRFDPEQSYAVLDASNSPTNMTVFINGVFYANRYFGSLVGAAAGGGGTGAVADNLTDQVVSVIDYMHYRERDFKIESLLFFGSENKVPGLLQNLSESLETPIFQPAQILKKTLIPQGNGQIDISNYLDAYGAALLPADASPDLNLAPPKKKTKLFDRFAVRVACFALVLGGILGSGVFFTQSKIHKLENTEKKLLEELTRYTITEADIAELSGEVNKMTQSISDVSTFNNTYPAAALVLETINTLTPAGTTVNSIAISNGNIQLNGSAGSMDQVTQMHRSLRTDALFTGATVPTTNTKTENGRELVDFTMTLALKPGEEVGK